jgi:two-component system chemotaxis response regulator CheB
VTASPAAVKPPIRALVAHGSAADRARLTALLRSDREVMVIGEAISVEQTVAMTRRHSPHVVAIGVHLPTDGGLAATRRIMVEAPTPIVIIADEFGAAEARLSMSALHAGAVAVIPKPWASRQAVAEPDAQRFVATIKALSQVKVIHHRHPPQMPVAPPPPPPLPRSRGPVRAVAVAASTGGPGALQELLSALPAGFPAPILVVQHMAPGFVQGLAAALDGLCAINVKVAAHGDPLLPQTAFLAPDGCHLGVSRQSRVVLSNDDPVSGFKPSATILFASVGRAFGPSAAHVILTGMGRDGVEGLAVAHGLGGRVLAQDRASSVVFGMPGEAVNAGVVDAVMPLASIAGELVALTRDGIGTALPHP